MTDFLLLLIFGACWIWGVHCLFADGYILSKFADYFRVEIPDSTPESYAATWYSKPLFDCPPCMASFHGGIIGVCFIGFHPSVIPYMVCLCGLNFIVKTILFPEYE